MQDRQGDLVCPSRRQVTVSSNVGPRYSGSTEAGPTQDRSGPSHCIAQSGTEHPSNSVSCHHRRSLPWLRLLSAVPSAQTLLFVCIGAAPYCGSLDRGALWGVELVQLNVIIERRSFAKRGPKQETWRLERTQPETRRPGTRGTAWYDYYY